MRLRLEILLYGEEYQAENVFLGVLVVGHLAVEYLFGEVEHGIQNIIEDHSNVRFLKEKGLEAVYEVGISAQLLLGGIMQKIG